MLSLIIQHIDIFNLYAPQDDLGGLEVKDIAKSWIDAKPIPGTILVIISLNLKLVKHSQRSNRNIILDTDGNGNQFEITF